jgi:Ser/Thr protein kinase RdoA (MazF antagonist)
VELLASGRTAEVFVWDDGRVLKLDRPEWNGLAAMEASALAIVTAAGIPAPRPYETVIVDGRHGVVMDRIDGPILSAVLAAAADLDALAATWTELHRSLNDRVVAGLPDLVAGLANGIRTSGLPPVVVDELLSLLERLDDGARHLCHFDMHPGNVIVGPDGWIVIDWMLASSGPPDADFARTLLLDPPDSSSTRAQFGAAVRREGMRSRGLDDRRLNAWVRVVAAARLAEGFEGEHAEYLTAVASGDRCIDD